MNKFLAILILFIGYLRSVSCILCYQCNSTDLQDPFQCQEFLGDDIDIQPMPCDEVYGAAYCIKHTGRFEGGIGTRRYCSSVDMGNYCNYIKQPGDQREYRSCKFTCDTDGCNSASIQTISASVLAAISAFTIIYRYF
uniref:Secreted Mys2-like protein n=1 Tax=Pristhesancus plagipennis TaxID=1955184 RepID=A0A2K8JSJ4_PRIPG|nr:secreted Mys2-like protein [Pristhesancus plagipennis]